MNFRLLGRPFEWLMLGLVLALSVSLAPHSGLAQGTTVVQAPALPGAQPISSADRVYTADQASNTVSVINPAANGNKGAVLGTIRLGKQRLDGVLGPVDTEQVNVHGLGFSRDGRSLVAISVTSNAAQVIDTSNNSVVQTTY